MYVPMWKLPIHHKGHLSFAHLLGNPNVEMNERKTMGISNKGNKNNNRNNNKNLSQKKRFFSSSPPFITKLSIVLK